MLTSRTHNATVLTTVGALTLVGAALATSPATSAEALPGVITPLGSIAKVDELYGVSADSPSDAWAIGVTPEFAHVIVHWDGTAWLPVQDVLSGGDAVAARTASDVWATGYGDGRAELEHWDGASWTLTPTPDVHGYFDDVFALSAKDAWAVGNEIHGRTRRTLIEHWDGSTWTRQASDPPDVKGSRYLYSVSADSPSDAWAVGDSQNNPIVLHWDGHAWNDVKTPPLENTYYVNSVSATAPDDVWAVGNLNVDFPVLNNTLAIHWDGTRWTEVSTPPTPDEAFFNDVQMVAPDDVWAVGQAIIPDRSEYRTLIEHWDGTSWRKVPSPNPTKTMNNVLSSVSFDSPTDAWSVGFTYYDSDERSLVLHWDGLHWTK